MKLSLRTCLGALLLVAASGCTAPARAATDRVTCTIELDRNLLAAEAVQRTVMKVALRASAVTTTDERPPVNLVVVLDRSGSMGGDKIERAKEAAMEALHRLGPKDLFSLVLYDHEVETVVPPQSASNVEWIEGRIRKIQSRGNTALFAGVSQGAAEMRKNLENRKYVPRILLLSDGQANVGPSAPEDLGRLGAALMKEGVAVTTVGVGTDYNEDLMTRLSQNSDGNAYFAANSAELPRIFNAELGGVLKVVARQVVLEITCTSGVKPLRIIGREGRIHGNTVEITLNQLYGGQEKYALIEVEVPAASANEERKIAVASCRYADAITQDDGKASTHATVRFSRDEKAVSGSFNAMVQRDIAFNTAAIANEAAISLNDAGKNALAAVHLREESERLRKVAKDYKLPEVEQQADELNAKAKVLSSRALHAEERKSMRTDSYQSRNQQQEK
jgi:Ca-activated chloride channel family protein